MPTIDRDGLTHHYELYGRGGSTPLVCLHGGGCRGSDFAALAAFFGDERQVLCPDLRGHGDTTVSDDGYDPDTQAADVAALCRHLGLGSVVVVGHSLGGAVGLAMTERDDVDVLGFVSLDSPIAVSDTMLGGISMLRDAFVADETPPIFREFMGAVVGFADDPDAHGALLDRLCSVAPHAMKRTLTGVAALDGVTRLARTTLPLVHIETGIGVSDVAKVAAARPDAWIGQVVGTAHYPHLESPAQVAAMIAHFLRRHRL